MLIAVLTGDIVRSRRMAPDERQRTLDRLDAALALPGLSEDPAPLARQMFRGDAFQLVLANPRAGLEAALHLLADLVAPAGRRGPALRVALGLGDWDRAGAAGEPGTWDGEPFRLSGRLLDGMGRPGHHLAVASPWPAVDAELAVSCRLADHLIARWTGEQARVMAALLGDRTQVEVAAALGISQSAVAQRYGNAGGQALRALVDRFRVLVVENES
ncbi:MAG: hypothetical protein JW819_08195 [Candidatus Krumholzibacteriota bacterium]|nr:hypothetical protein [Candidatus Krumholzibacteriota bacterium]